MVWLNIFEYVAQCLVHPSTALMDSDLAPKNPACEPSGRFTLHEHSHARLGLGDSTSLLCGIERARVRCQDVGARDLVAVAPHQPVESEHACFEREGRLGAGEIARRAREGSRIARG